MASFWVPVVWQLARGATPTRKERYGDRGNRSYLSEGGVSANKPQPGTPLVHPVFIQRA